MVVKVDIGLERCQTALMKVIWDAMTVKPLKWRIYAQIHIVTNFI